ncbi:YitT family protein [Paenibacillus lycopersici]|uniref:YitT family protein n=1 Tax=Paenibacillus lycopersici TaxID=2704462 RepID=A0A6C0FY22_9BACL|nr:YitT family protein [Paenibacillus lycopersici]QHT60164.1 YitT family protein [Paenibacillus lycopersici]
MTTSLRPSTRTSKIAATTLISALLIAYGFNQLLIPLKMISGGVSGITMIIGYATGLNIGWLYFILNVPVLIWGWRELGLRFVGWSLVAVIATTIFMQLIPTEALVQDLTLGAVFGGVVVGFGSGLALRAGSSSGGFDIIAAILSRKRDMSIGMVIFALNGSVIAALGFLTDDWDVALFSLLSIFTTGKIIDLIHINHVKMTAFIVTSRTEAMREALIPLYRGVTVIRTRGGYTNTENDMLMTVTTRYELNELRKIIAATDPKAFVNIVETVGVLGDFRKPVL